MVRWIPIWTNLPVKVCTINAGDVEFLPLNPCRFTNNQCRGRRFPPHPHRSCSRFPPNQSRESRFSPNPIRGCRFPNQQSGCRLCPTDAGNIDFHPLKNAGDLDSAAQSMQGTYNSPLPVYWSKQEGPSYYCSIACNEVGLHGNHMTEEGFCCNV